MLIGEKWDFISQFHYSGAFGPLFYGPKIGFLYKIGQKGIISNGASSLKKRS